MTGAILFLVALYIAFLALSMPDTYKATGMDPDTVAAENVRGQYQTFVRWAVFYMAANPAANGTFDWSDIVATPGVPQGVTLTNMPSNWTIVANGTSYVLCTEMPTGLSAAMLGEILDGQERVEKLVKSGDKYVIADPASATIATEAAKCP